MSGQAFGFLCHHVQLSLLRLCFTASCFISNKVQSRTWFNTKETPEGLPKAKVSQSKGIPDMVSIVFHNSAQHWYYIRNPIS